MIESSSAATSPAHGASRWWIQRVSRPANIVAVGLGVVISTALLAWIVGRVFTDRFAWTQWLWWTPTPAALVLAGLGWLLALRPGGAIGRRRRLAIWSVIVSSLLVYFVAIEHRLWRPAPVAPTQALTLAHWNMTLDNNADVPRLLDAVERMDADVTVLTSPPGDVRILLPRRAQERHETLETFAPWPMYLYSRLPILSARVLVATDGMYIAEARLDATQRVGRPITLWLVDLPSNLHRPRMPIAREARRLITDLKVGAPDVIVGDFNMPRGSASIRTLFPGMAHVFSGGGHGYGATFSRRFPLYHIDHVLLSEHSGLTCPRYDLIDAGQSRHLAQKAWIIGQ